MKYSLFLQIFLFVELQKTPTDRCFLVTLLVMNSMHVKVLLYGNFHFSQNIDYSDVFLVIIFLF